MAEEQISLDEFLRRLSADSGLYARAIADPLSVVRAEGVMVRARDVKQLLGIAGCTDYELFEILMGHIRRAPPSIGRSLMECSIPEVFPDGPPTPTRRAWQPVTTGLPLGARPEAGLTDDQVSALKALEAYDLRSVGHYLNATSELPAGWLEDGLYEFRRYLGLRRVFNRTFAMFSEQVDDVWHTCLLFTELYMDLCHRVFGEFAHHDPWDEPKPEQIVNLWRQFHTAYRHLYGEMSYLWTLRLPEDARFPVAGYTPSGATAGGIDNV